MPRFEPSPEHLARIASVVDNPQGRAVGVLGLGVVGKAMTRLLVSRGANTMVADRRADVVEEVCGWGTGIASLSVAPEAFVELDGLAISPGVDPRQEAVSSAWSAGLPVFGELELCKKLPAPVVGISGTNGKSTSTAMLGSMLKSLGGSPFVGGNLGDSLAAFMLEPAPVDSMILELSSFQLETAYRFSAQVAVLLNITPDHGERYGSFDDYVEAKARLIENTSPSGTVILNADDPVVVELASRTKASCLWFTTQGALAGRQGVVVVNGLLRAEGDRVAHLDGFDLSHPQLKGNHNHENTAAVLLALTALWGPKKLDELRAAYLNFGGLAHRLEIIAEVEGVEFINDSKATNDQAAATALRAVSRPTILMLGGRDKNGGYAEVVAAASNVKHVLAYGEARDTIDEALGEALAVTRLTSFDEAFEQACLEAEPGDTVLLAPACSSFDEFENYARRGDRFRELVAARKAMTS